MWKSSSTINRASLGKLLRLVSSTLKITERIVWSRAEFDTGYSRNLSIHLYYFGLESAYNKCFGWRICLSLNRADANVTFLFKQLFRLETFYVIFMAMFIRYCNFLILYVYVCYDTVVLWTLRFIPLAILLSDTCFLQMPEVIKLCVRDRAFMHGGISQRLQKKQGIRVSQLMFLALAVFSLSGNLIIHRPLTNCHNYAFMSLIKKMCVDKSVISSRGLITKTITCILCTTDK